MPPKSSKIDISANSVASDFVVSVTSSAHRRRAGISFGPTPVDLTVEQLRTEIGDSTVQDLILADPLLVIREYKPTPEAEAPKE